MLEKALDEAKLPLAPHAELFPEQREHLKELLHREHGLADNLISFYERHNTPAVDLITVTSGPGLEPALWVGVNFAKALAYLWNIPIVPVNHMEGHVLSSIFDGVHLPDLAFPALALLISGGHTELVLMRDWGTYELVGQTRDDAVGEAFDKVARMLGLPYPGGPEISRLASFAREENLPEFAKLPKPMIDSPNTDFSFSGLKTAVRYAIRDKELGENDKKAIARDFENVVTEVLLRKTEKALIDKGAQSLIIGGGVSANTYLRKNVKHHFGALHPDVAVYLPEQKLTTDNSIMIALAGHARIHEAMSPEAALSIQADGNRSLSKA
jgi:N6-L-threonylcarbamoyladenine synthase